MVPHENKILNELSVKTSDAVLEKIDPFDYDVFNPFIHTNVKKSVQRSLVSILSIYKKIYILEILCDSNETYNI